MKALDAATQAAQEILTEGEVGFAVHRHLTTQKVEEATRAGIAAYLSMIRDSNTNDLRQSLENTLNELRCGAFTYEYCRLPDGSPPAGQIIWEIDETKLDALSVDLWVGGWRLTEKGNDLMHDAMEGD